MALQDSNPERRNLTVLSLSIIAFFLADGTFTDSIVRLQIVNVQFSKPEVLSLFVWGLLVWFQFRYWLTHQGGWRAPFYSELDYVPTFIYSRYLAKKFNLSDDYSRSYYPDRHSLRFDSQHGPKLKFMHIYKSETNAQLTEMKEIETWNDKVLIVISAIYLFFRKPSLSEYFIPYFLFVWAVSLGVLNAS